MVEQPYYVAERGGGSCRYTDLIDAINQYGRRRAGRNEAKYDRGGSASYTHVEVKSWAGGPLLYVESFDEDDETEYPVIENGMVRVVVHAGYVPWGFRPERASTPDDREYTGRWLWYLMPIGAITDGNAYDTVYAIKTGDGYLRSDDGDLVTFDSEADAAAVADQVQDDEVVEVPQ